jgi:YaiO family outer membrane protein
MPDFRATAAWMAVCLALVPFPVLSAAEPVLSYESALRQAQQSLHRDQPAAAEPLFRTMLERFPGNPEVLAGLVDSLCRQARYAEGLAVAGTIRDPASSVELERQRHRCDFEARLAAARAQPAREADLATLRALHEDWPDDPYTTGWLYARALEAQGLSEPAEALYDKLAARYPADGDFARQGDRLRLDRKARETQAAASNARYPNRLTASVGGARYDRDSPDDSVQALSWTRSSQGRALTLAAEHQQRFGQSSSSLSATLDTRLAPGYDGAFSVSWSPQGRFLPEYSVGADIGRYTGAGRAYLAIRHLSFENSSATLLAPGFLWETSERFRLDTRVYWVPRSDSWSVVVAPQWSTTGGHRTTLTLSGGMASEQLDIAGGTLRASTYSVRLAQRWRVANRWAVGGDVFHEHRSGLYNRSGATLQAVYSW